jgi:hypothetical protein
LFAEITLLNGILVHVIQTELVTGQVVELIGVGVEDLLLR